MLQDPPTKPRAVPELIDTIATNIAHLNKNNEVHCHYVPGHQGIEMNEKVDELAKVAVDTAQILQHDPIPATYTNRIREQAQKIYKNTLTCPYVTTATSNNTLPATSSGTKPQMKKQAANTRKIHTTRPLLNRARTGHCATRSHLKNVSIEDDDTADTAKKHQRP